MSLRVETFKGRYEEFPSVRAYLESNHWAFSRLMWKNKHPGATCFICGRRDFDLHHRTYARAGMEHADDLVPLCEDHHHEVEKWIAKGEARRYDAHISYKAALDARAGRRTSEGLR